MLTVRNTFLHCSGVEGSPQGEAGLQPSLSRSKTAPAARPLDEEDDRDEDCDPSPLDPAALRVPGDSPPTEGPQPRLERFVTHDRFELDALYQSDQGPCGCPARVEERLTTHSLEVPMLLGRTGGHAGAGSLACMSWSQVRGETRPAGTDCGAVQKMRAEGSQQVSQGKAAACDRAAPSDSAAQDMRTTIMLRNLPNNYSREQLLELLDARGFVGRYDFVYLPIDFKTHAALGYAFVNLLTPADALGLWSSLEHFSNWGLPSSKTCRISWSHPHQGIEAHVQRYRSSPLMHDRVPDAYRPVLFCGGVRVPFPLPTKKIKIPRKGNERMLV